MSIVSTHIKEFAKMEGVKESDVVAYELDDKRKTITRIEVPDKYENDGFLQLQSSLRTYKRPDGFVYIVIKHYQCNNITIIKCYAYRLSAGTIKLYEYVWNDTITRSHSDGERLLLANPDFKDYRSEQSSDDNSDSIDDMTENFVIRLMGMCGLKWDFGTTDEWQDSKYILTDETIEYDGHILHRIQANKDIPLKGAFPKIKKGELGGFIESEKNLSQDGNCWIYPDAKVYDDAVVKDNARVLGTVIISGCAEVSENCEILSHIYGDAKIRGGGVITDHVTIFGDIRRQVCKSYKIKFYI